MRKILFVKTKHLGDSVILTSSIRAVSKSWMVDVFCHCQSESVFYGNPGVAQIYHPPNRTNFPCYLFRYLRLFWLLRKNRYDAVIQFSDDWRGGLISFISGASVRVCRQSLRRPKLWHWAFNYCAPRIICQRHSAEQDMDLLRYAGLTERTKAPPYALYPNAEADLRVRTWLKTNGLVQGNYIIVNAATRWKFKTLLPQQWQQVVTTLLERDINLVFSGSREDRLFYETFVDQASRIACDFDLHETFSLYRYSRALLSIDSLSIHVASAFNIPTFAIFGPSGEAQWRPLHTTSEIYEQSAKFPCRPCGRDGCESTKISQCLVTFDGRRIAQDFISFVRNIPEQ